MRESESRGVIKRKRKAWEREREGVCVRERTRGRISNKWERDKHKRKKRAGQKKIEGESVRKITHLQAFVHSILRV